MNTSMVRYLLAKLLLIEAILLLLPLLVAIIYQEDTILAFLKTIGILAILGCSGLMAKPKNYRIYTKEGTLIVSLCWILWSFFGSLPFVFSGQIPSLIDAFFETSSGFTTTGATILNDVSVLSHAMIFWRSFAHLIGGMGVLVFALAIMNNTKNAHLEVMRAEVPGPVFGKIVSKLKNTAQILYIIYLIMFALFAILLYLAGMPFFDSLITAMGTAGTGGFGVYNDSIAHYDSSLLTNMVSVGTLIFGINFNLYYLILLGKLKTVFKDEELRLYLLIIAVSTFLIFLNVGGIYATDKIALETIFFEVTNVITTTGFSITDLTVWPLFSQYILLLLMFVGGCAGSTAGGFKVMRLLLLSKIAKNQVRSSLSPNCITTIHVNGQVLDKDTQNNILKYLTIYVFFFILLILIISLDSSNFMVITSAAISTFNNIGPILGSNDTFAFFSPFSKLVLSFAMIAGRLELFPILLLLSPKTWSKV